MFSFVKVSDVPSAKNAELPNRLWAFIWYFARQAKGSFLTMMILMAVSTTCMSLTSYFIKMFVDTLGADQALENIWGDILRIAMAYILVCGVLQSVLWRVATYIKARTESTFTNMVRRQLARYMNKHSYSYFQNDFAGRLSSKVIETPGAIRTTIINIIHNILYNFVSFAVSFFLLASVGMDQLLVMLSISLFYAATLKIYLPQIKSMSKTAADIRSHMRGHYVDILTNIVNVKLFSRDQHEDSHFLKSLQKSSDGYEARDLKFFDFMCKLDTLMKAVWVIPPAFAMYAWYQGAATTGDIAMVLALSVQLGGNMWGFTFTLSGFFESLGEVEEGMETIVQPHGLVDKARAKKLKVKRGEIHFDNIDFNYGQEAVFNNFDLKIVPGQKVGLIGISGAGKSTMVNLLLRLYDVDNGSIKIDGQKISDVKIASLREQISVIPQSTQLFHRSLRENIRYGDISASDEDVIRAAKKAHAHSFIKNMQDHYGNKGYDAKAGERGVKLSGGQRQRVAIARAIIKDAPILILDEATSALDSESEALIQKSLKSLMKGKTVIAIAHRLSTIAHLDRLIVLDKGRIIEDGSHAELLKQKGLYAKLWSMQSGGFLNPDVE